MSRGKRNSSYNPENLRAAQAAKAAAMLLTYEVPKGGLHLNEGEGPPRGYTGKVFYKNRVDWRKEGRLHREGGKPACVFKNGRKEWLVDGKHYRDNDKPAIDDNGYQVWFKYGLIHRKTGPAIIYPDGSKEYWKDGTRHRTRGPAVIHSHGGREWYIKDRRHREDGPAVIYPEGAVEYWIDGSRLNEEKWQEHLDRREQERLAKQLEKTLARLSSQPGPSRKPRRRISPLAR